MSVIRCAVWMIFFTVTLTSAHADGVVERGPERGKGGLAAEQKSPTKFTQTGRASYYHKSLRGLKTANGERYDPNAMTAAHRRLKLGTYVRVTHLRNNRSVVVKVNDRLPPHGRAIIDLSTGAARKLGMIRTGIAKVKIEALSEAEVEELLAAQ